MTSYRLLLLFVVFIWPIRLTAAGSPLEAAEGWRLPNDSDMVKSWAKFQGLTKVPYRVRSDFNGDGVVDDAYLALSANGTGWALFVNLNLKTTQPGILKLIENAGKNIPQSMRVSVAKAGLYRTACGKWYWPCEADEPPGLRLSLPAVDFHSFEGAGSLFWWDHKASRFRQTWISD